MTGNLQQSGIAIVTFWTTSTVFDIWYLRVFYYQNQLTCDVGWPESTTIASSSSSSLFNSTCTSLLSVTSTSLDLLVCITDDDDDDEARCCGCWYQEMFTGLPPTVELTDAAYSLHTQLCLTTACRKWLKPKLLLGLVTINYILIVNFWKIND